MNSTEKDNIIQKAICCSGALGKSVADMYLRGDKCADKEFDKLFLLISYTETLGCYEAPLEVTTYEVVEGEPVLSEWSLTIPCDTWDTIATTDVEVELVVDGDPQAVTGDDTSTYGELLLTLISDLGFTYTGDSCVDDNIVLIITAACDTESIQVNIANIEPSPDGVDLTYNAIQVTAGNCTGSTIETVVTTTTYTNCLTETQADNIATQISKLCDLCDEH